MTEIKAPTKFEKNVYNSKYISLAGSIEMGKAENWQSRIIKDLKDENVVFLNPRRDDWDSSWKQEKDNPQFREQVEWELYSMERADIIVMYLSPGTISPISLLELGIWCLSKKIIVYCPEGFQRKGNVDIVCERYKTTQVQSWEELIDAVRNRL
jgi:hypothetical protein